MKIKEIEKFLKEKTGELGGEEGFLFGNTKGELKGILVSWMATTEAIKKARKEDCNLMIVHEDPFFPPPSYAHNIAMEKYLSHRVNRARTELLSQYRITVFRAHGSLDRLCVLDDFWKVLGFPRPIIKEGFYRIFKIEPIKVKDLAKKVKKAMRLNSMRVTGDLDKKVSKIGLPWGGLGLSINAAFISQMLEYGVDALIAGETDEYSMFAVADSNVALIETSHTISENPGLSHFAEMLKKRFPKLKVIFFSCPRPWTFS